MQRRFKIFLLYSLISFCNNLFSQQEASNWIITDSIQMKFVNGKVILINPKTSFGTGEPNSAISDSNGNLLLYADEHYIYSANNSQKLRTVWTYTRWSAHQGALILKHPKSKIYHFFSTETTNGFSIPILHSTIRINNKAPEFINKHNRLVNRASEKLNAVNHQNKRDIWIATHSFLADTFHFFLLKKNGLICCPVKQVYGNYYRDWASAQGAIKFSNSGKLMGVTSHNSINTQLFIFNSESSHLSNSINLNDRYGVGIEFSPNSNYVYINNVISVDKKLVQYDISNWNQSIINKSKYVLFDTFINAVKKFRITLQLANNNQVYCLASIDSFIYTINNPNLKGKACNLTTKDIFLNKLTYKSLPNFNQSYFYQPAVDYAYEQECMNNSIQFWGEDTLKSTSQQWLIKKGATTEATYNTVNINHTFKDTGKYQVSYIVSGTANDTVTKTITIYPKLKLGFLGKDTFYCKGTQANITLQAPPNLHCVHWYKDSTTNEISRADSLTVDAAGTYYVKITNKSFCVRWDTITITEMNPPSIVLKPVTDTCQYAPFNFTAISKNNPTKKHQWTMNGKAKTQTDSFYTIDIVTFEKSRGKIQAICQISNYCFTASDTQTIYYKPKAGVTPDTLEGCTPFVFFGRRAGLRPWHTDTWYIDGLKTPHIGLLIRRFFAPREYLLTYTLGYAYNQCLDSQNFKMTVHPNPKASFTYNPTDNILVGELVNFTNTSKNARTYEWDFGEFGNSWQTNPSRKFSEVKAYTVQMVATDAKNCTDTATQSIIVNKQGLWYLPSALHLPNEDNPLTAARGNDVFKPVGVGIKSYHIYIVSRWGKIMHNRNIPYHPKPGTLQGNYYFHVKVVFENGKTDEKKGSLFILD